MSFKAIIVDDIALSREHLRISLDDPDIEIVAECAGGAAAIEAIRELKPDLVFLDVQMPRIGEFQVIESIGVEQMPSVVFVTAYNDFALQAFEVNAIDYLLKPIDPKRLAKAVEKAKQEIRTADLSTEIENKLRKLLDARTEPEYLKRIPVKSGAGTILIDIAAIEWIGSAGHYVELHVGRATHCIRQRMSHLEKLLDPRVFVRIHRSKTININAIKSVQPLFSGDQLITLKSGSTISSSRTYLDELKYRLTH